MAQKRKGTPKGPFLGIGCVGLVASSLVGSVNSRLNSGSSGVHGSFGSSSSFSGSSLSFSSGFVHRLLSGVGGLIDLVLHVLLRAASACNEEGSHRGEQCELLDHFPVGIGESGRKSNGNLDPRKSLALSGLIFGLNIRQKPVRNRPTWLSPYLTYPMLQMPWNPISTRRPCASTTGSIMPPM